MARVPVSSDTQAPLPIDCEHGVTAGSREWLPAEVEGRIDAGEIHVWLARLDRPETERRAFEATLSPDEADRAGRFCFEEHRAHYVVARGLLRALLGRYLGVHPAAVRFAYDAHGKPALDGGASADLAFNVSHSGGLALCGISRVGPLGVDIETWRFTSNRDGIAARYFAQGEVRRLQALPATERMAAFFDCWTRKEAFVKAIGHGLGHPLDRFEVSFEPGVPARLLDVDGDADEAAHWTLEALPHVPGYSAALAVRRRPVAITCRAWVGGEDRRT